MATSSLHSSAVDAAGRFGRSNGGRRSAFTLVELLVSMAILSLIVVLVAQLVNSASTTNKLQAQRLDTDGEARMIFDRMALDFAGMLRRDDLDSTAFKYPNYRGGGGGEFKRAGNDGFLFFSQAVAMGANATAPQDSISLIGYRIYEPAGGAEDSFQLDRCGRGADWAGPGGGGAIPTPGIPYLSFPNPVSTVPGNTDQYAIEESKAITKYWPDLESFDAPGAMSPKTADGPFHTLSRNAFRLEFALLMNDGTFVATDYLDYADPNQRAFKNVRAIVATIALLDPLSRSRLGPDPSGALQSIAGKLKDNYTADAAKDWSNTILTDTSIPPVAATNARVYQRYFYLK